eukprot:jgi/Astpho2/6359/Aster-06022
MPGVQRAGFWDAACQEDAAVAAGDSDVMQRATAECRALQATLAEWEAMHKSLETIHDQLAARMETVQALEMPAVVMKKSGLGRTFGALAKRAEPELQRVADAATRQRTTWFQTYSGIAAGTPAGGSAPASVPNPTAPASAEAAGTSSSSGAHMPKQPAGEPGQQQAQQQGQQQAQQQKTPMQNGHTPGVKLQQALAPSPAVEAGGGHQAVKRHKVSGQRITLSRPGNKDRDHAVCILQVALSTPKQVTSHQAATQMEAEVFRACAENGIAGTRYRQRLHALWLYLGGEAGPHAVPGLRHRVLDGIVSPAEVATCSFSQARKLGGAAQTQQAPAGSGSQAVPGPSAGATSLPPWQEPQQQHSQQHQLAAPAGAASGAAGLHGADQPKGSGGQSAPALLPALPALLQFLLHFNGSEASWQPLQVPAIPGHPQKPPNPPGLPQQLLSLLGPSEQLPSHPGPQLQSVPSFNDDMDMDMS